MQNSSWLAYENKKENGSPGKDLHSMPQVFYMEKEMAKSMG